MNTPIIINEVIGRAEQGMTRPFVCVANMGIHYVKGAYAGKNTLCCEWVANRLVNILVNVLLPGSPLGVPLFSMAEVPRALVESSARPDIRDLGEGMVFASLRIDDGQELTWSAAHGWSEETMALLLLLDLWIQNEDRSLSAMGGNPNLLVTQIPPLPDDDPEGALWKDQPRREMLWAYGKGVAARISLHFIGISPVSGVVQVVVGGGRHCLAGAFIVAALGIVRAVVRRGGGRARVVRRVVFTPESPARSARARRR